MWTFLALCLGVLLEYLDNDNDGKADDPSVVSSMVRKNAAMVLFKDEAEQNNHNDLFGLNYGFQNLFETETHPDGIPYDNTSTAYANGQFDATLEEVLHVINQHGHNHAYHSRLGTQKGSELADAMDVARGGRFTSVPSSYPASAWYTYYDTTCTYDCMAIEYLYWALTSILGAQDHPRNPPVTDEWKLTTEQLVRNQDTKVYALLTDPALKLPTKLPDGNYQPVSGK